MNILRKPAIMLFIFLLVAFRFCQTSANPANRTDVIGRYALANEEQCRRLCWYRSLCVSYSFDRKSVKSLGRFIADHTCFLHTDPGTAQNNTEDVATTTTTLAATDDDGWVEKAATDVHINNGYFPRPCSGEQICIPTSQLGMTSSVSTPYACHDYRPAQCGDPGDVTHGYVIKNGTSQGDVGHVICYDNYVASPKGVSMEIVCSVTSRWTPSQGACEQFMFRFGPYGIYDRMYTLPWKLEENSKLCVKGVFTEAGYLALNFKQPPGTPFDTKLQVTFRSETSVTFWNFVDENGNWLENRALPDHPLVSGDGFNITMHLLTDSLQIVLNKVHIFVIPLVGVTDRSNNVIDIRKTEKVGFRGDISLSYVNLIAGCE